ncbi:hypothetical protein FKM82_023573, partial [Ascaphus truei]
MRPASHMEATDARHSSSLLLELNNQRLMGLFCDVTVIVEDTKFRAHRNVLAAASSYFKEILSARSPRCLDPVLELPDVSAQAFSNILGFIYSSQLTVPGPALAREVSVVSKALGVSSLVLGDLTPEQKDHAQPGASPNVSTYGLDSDGSEPPGSSCKPYEIRLEEPRTPKCSGDAGDLHRLLPPPTTSRLSPETRRTCQAAATEEKTQHTPPPDQGHRTTSMTEDTSEGSESETPHDGGSPSRRTREPLCCRHCGQYFRFPAALRLHTKLHKARRPLSCRSCGRSFTHVKRLQAHEVQCQGEQEVPYQEMQEVSVQVEQEVQFQGAEETLCQHEGLYLQSNSILPDGPGSGSAMMHPPSTPPISHFQAPPGLLCPQGPLRSLEFMDEQDHSVKVVDGHVIYACAVCERSYMTLSSLKRHSNVHSWRRRYPCRYCDKVFALAEYRTKHEVWHTGERRYQCIFCWDTFVTYYNLKTHQKTFHGIDPGLISSEKTQNGGYKPKLNALKLYRLLPMKAQRRPYKTYSEPGSALPIEPHGTLPLPVTKEDFPDNDLPSADQAHPSPELDAMQGTPYTRDAISQSEAERPVPIALTPMGAQGDTAAHSVIAFCHSASSVIVHSTSVSSSPGPREQSVISYEPSPSHALPPRPPINPDPTKPTETHVLSDLTTESTEEEEEEEEGDMESGDCKETTITYVAKPACAGGASGSRSGSLCQITVRIGEEAIVKRKIPETDLVRDKRHRSKSRRINPGGKKREERHSRSDEKRRGQRTSEERYCKTSEECAQKTSVSKARESDPEDSDQGEEDQLWRPYYSYKPKHKACGGVQRVKRSRWKLRYKRSLKRARREEETMAGERHRHSPRMSLRRDGPEQERNDCSHEDLEPSVSGNRHLEQDTPESDALEQCVSDNDDLEQGVEQDKSGDNREHGQSGDKDLEQDRSESKALEQVMSDNNDLELGSSGNKSPGQDISESMQFPGHGQQSPPPRARGSEWRYQCATCGKQFSALRKLTRHQLACERRSQAAPCDGVARPEDAKRAHRVGRRPSIKHTCPACPRVCKTAAALSRHMKRHKTEPPTRETEAHRGPANPLTVITHANARMCEGSAELSPAVQEGGKEAKEESAQETHVSSSSGETPILAAPQSPFQRDLQPDVHHDDLGQHVCRLKATAGPVHA